MCSHEDAPCCGCAREDALTDYYEGTSATPMTTTISEQAAPLRGAALPPRGSFKILCNIFQIIVDIMLASLLCLTCQPNNRRELTCKIHADVVLTS